MPKPDDEIEFIESVSRWYPKYASNAAIEQSFVTRRLGDADLSLKFLAKDRRRVVVQAGGHVGDWPRRLSESFAQVITCEPEPLLYRCLVKNGVPLNVLPVNIALGSFVGQVRFLRRASPSTSRVHAEGQITVQQTTVDALVADSNCDAIILDVEGHEREVLIGARETIERCRPVIQVELLERSAKEIVAMLASLGYEPVTKKGRDRVFAYVPKLITEAYRALNVKLHAKPEGYGGRGYKHADAILDFAMRLEARSLLDYGCGEGSLCKVIAKAHKAKETAKGVRAWLAALESGLKLREYDPAISGKEDLPKPADLVVCTDVLEHIEPECLTDVLMHLRALTKKGCYLSVATRPANKNLADGRNAHLIVEEPPWWWEKLQAVGFVFNKTEIAEGHSFRVWAMVR